MMEGSQGWWSMNNVRAPQPTFPLLPPFTTPSTSSSSSSSAFSHQYPLASSSLPPTSAWHDNQDMQPDSWSPLLLGGVVGEAERCTLTSLPPKMENWIHSTSSNIVNVKQETPNANGTYMHGNYNDENDEIQHAAVARSQWNTQLMPVSSSKYSYITSWGSNMLDFSNRKGKGRHPMPDHSSECNSSISGSSLKKARVQPSSTPQSTFKVRKQKLGDRITVLHQLVSPFGKTDTASVLLEAIGCIRFLQGQIEALSSPYLGNNAPQPTRQPSQGERSSSIFPGDSGQLLDDACLKRRGACDNNTKDGNDEQRKELTSIGLCLVPISCTTHVGSQASSPHHFHFPHAWCGLLARGGELVFLNRMEMTKMVRTTFFGDFR